MVSTQLASAQLRFSEQGNLSDELFEEATKKHFVQYRGERPLKDSTFVARYFVFYMNDGTHNGGMGFEIASTKTNNPIWSEMPYGDFPPHTISLLDLNNDGMLDLMYLMGSEDVYSTKVYLSTTDITNPNIAFSQNNFNLQYENNNEYLVLVDIDQNGKPELLDSGYKGRTNKSTHTCVEYESLYSEEIGVPSLFINESLAQEIKTKYDAITTNYTTYNFDYNMPDSYQIYNSFLLSPIKVIIFEGSDVIEVTESYTDYIEWRIDILTKAKKNSSEECNPRIKKTIDYLNAKLAY